MHVVGPTIMIYMVNSSIGLLKLLVLNLGFNTYFALLSLWVWAEVEDFRD